MLVIPAFEEKTALFDWLIANKSALTNQKKSIIKHADAFNYACPIVTPRGEAVKAESAGVPDTATKIKVRSIINTTNLFDSHQDVHFPQLWNKSLKENKENYLVNQHAFTFEGIITDNVHAFAKVMTWKDLGFDWEGTTQALVFDSVIERAESPFMFEKYRTGRVKQHSVGMRYVKIELAINDDRYEKEFGTWAKYIDQIVNREDVEENGYFWAVTEAKIVEGSAVVRGSNFVTPTQSVAQAKNIEPPAGTQKSRAVNNTRVLHELNNLLNKLQS